jgi:hypothetical protein
MSLYVSRPGTVQSLLRRLLMTIGNGIHRKYMPDTFHITVGNQILYDGRHSLQDRPEVIIRVYIILIFTYSNVHFDYFLSQRFLIDI